MDASRSSLVAAKSTEGSLKSPATETLEERFQPATSLLSFPHIERGRDMTSLVGLIDAVAPA